MMRRLIPAAAAIVLAATLAVPAAVAKKDGERFKEATHETFDTGKSGRFTLSNVNGSVTVTGYDGSAIEVDAVKYASSQERLAETTIKSSVDDGRVTIEVEIEDDDRWDNGSSRVDFEIRVPRGTRIDDLELVNGNLKLEGISGRVDAASVNGDVTAERLSGDVDLSAVNGDVYLTVAGAVESIKLHSVNGMVELVVPRDASARVSASTVHGSIRAAGDVRAEKNFVGSSLTGVLGKGEGKIDMNTVNGDIRIFHDDEDRDKDED
ncbi:MAG TPA: DUF4097 family beta strand repeat-containing protein [Candidatus Krumholzibacteria bacterium]|nr:DUF4097 family beta strand repeat-containing protein [Candidatus Krumholzibacteria bacterium]